MKKCIICNSSNYTKRDGSVRDIPKLDILECNRCGLVFLSDFSHIDEKFYENSNMHIDTNIDIMRWLKETEHDDNRRYNFLKNVIIDKNILDFGSGAGGFLQKCKPLSNYLTGLELDKKVKDYYLKNNIKYENKIDNLEDNSFDIITMFHVLEHIANPQEVLKNLIQKLKKDGSLIIEVPNANDALLTLYKNKPFSNFTYWSCHLYLYTQHTLMLLAKKVGIKVEFIKYIQRYPLSNHLYWLSNGKPSGDKIWGNFLDTPVLNQEYESSLASIGATDTIIAKFIK